MYQSTAINHQPIIKFKVSSPNPKLYYSAKCKCGWESIIDWHNDLAWAIESWGHHAMEMEI
jgi:hypothetical protein